MTAHRRPRTLLASVSLMALVATGLSACEDTSVPGAASGADQAAAGVPAQEPARLVLNVRCRRPRETARRRPRSCPLAVMRTAH